ncbi:outer membrane beta-barrel protein [candidate division TA06 bacterium]|nr:outer membrane beta-barrel protein [candidate division TA06 bacterium]
MTRSVIMFTLLLGIYSISNGDTLDVKTPGKFNGRYHISFGLVNYYTANVFTFPNNLDSTRNDSFNSFDCKGLSVCLRYTLNKNVDFTAEYWRWTGMSGKPYARDLIYPKVDGFGLGIQHNINEFCDLFDPIIKANINYYRETIDQYTDSTGSMNLFSEYTFGFCAVIGSDWKISKHFSIPGTIGYHFIKGNKDFSGLDFNFGVSYNFGK